MVEKANRNVAGMARLIHGSPAQRRTSVRAGFTLIELLAVIVIIGILAAVAIPKFTKARERAHYKTIISDLRNLQAQQEIYYALPGSFSYAGALTDLDNYSPSNGVNITILEASRGGWAATAGHVGMTAAQFCAVYTGTVAAVPAPATSQNVITCTGE